MQNISQEAQLKTEHRGLRVALDIKKDPLTYFTRLMNREGAYARLNISGRPLVVLNDATGIEHVLVKNNANYCKGHFQKMLKPAFGDSMFLHEGKIWKQRREEAAPVFAHGNFEDMVEQITASAEAMLERWKPAIAQGQPIDMTLEMTRFALEALLRALFHEPSDDVAAEMRSSLGVILRDADKRMWSAINLPKFIAFNLPKYKTSLKFMKRMVADLIAARRESNAYPEDLLSTLVNEFGKTPEEQKILFDEVRSFLLAGHETTAHGLAWALYTLSLHPDVLQKVEEEVAQVLGDQKPTMDHIKKLVYTQQAFNETLRLFPPVWTMSREAIKDDNIPLDDGSIVPVAAGTAIMMCHYTVHRRELYWPNPEAFDPNRFAPGTMGSRPRFAWFPFGGGPRLCLGFRFAQVESVIALAMIIRKYKFSLISGQVIRSEPIITLRPEGSMFFKMKPRSDELSEMKPANILDIVTSIASANPSKCPFHSKSA